MKRTALTALALASALCIAPLVSACSASGGSSTSTGDGTNATAQKEPAEFKAGKNDSIKIEEIAWTVDESVVEGTRYPTFSYTNNSSFPIAELKIEFTQRADVTDEDRAVFDEVYEKNQRWTTEPEDMYVLGQGPQYVEPGESTDPYQLSLSGTVTPVGSMDQYDLMEPSVMTVIYLGDDGQVYLEYYDFKTGRYSQSSQSGQPAVSWSDSELAQMVPTVEAPVVTCTEYDDYFSFKAVDKSANDYNSYVEQCKEKGFTQDSYEGTEYYRASNEDGDEITVSFSSQRHMLSVSVSSNE